MIWIITSIIILIGAVWFFITIKNDFKRIDQEEKELEDYIKKLYNKDDQNIL